MADEKPLPNKWLIEIGKITQSWAVFEQFYNLMLQKLAGFNDPFDPVFTILVAHSSMPQRLDMFESLCVRLVAGHARLSDYKDVLGKVRTAQTLRNRFAHCVISCDDVDGDAGTRGVVSARGALKQELAPMQFSDLEAANNAIKDASQAVYNLVIRPESRRPS